MADYSLQALARYLPELQNLNVQSLGQGAPMVGGSLGLPAVDPNLSVEGSYHRPDAQSPPDWRTLLTYRRQF